MNPPRGGGPANYAPIPIPLGPIANVAGAGGACCEACARGGSCVSGCGGARVGEAPSLEEKAILFSDLVTADATVRRFNDEVVAASSGPDAAKLGNLPLRWSIFYPTWTVWFGALDARNKDIQSKSLGLAPEILTGDGVTTFDKLMLDFNGFLDEFKKLGGKSTVDPVDTRSAGEKGLSGFFSGIGGAFSSAAAGAATVLTYAAVIGALGLGLYAFGPYLVSKVPALVGKIRP